MTTPPRILTIAGSDSSGGAGIQADIKTVTMLGGYAMSAITAVTAQNTLGVQTVEALSSHLVAAQIDSCIGDIGVDAIKIGMLGSAAIAKLVADKLEGLAVPIVFDPVMVATSGAALADSATIEAFERLMALATVTTPNVHELAALGGDAAMARRAIAYLAKGGDAAGNLIEDRLIVPGQPPVVWQSARIVTRHTHGTGCTLASAIATFLGLGLDLVAAVARAREFVNLAMRDAPGLGAGQGPLGHAAVRLDLTGEPRFNQLTLPAQDYAASCAFYRALGLQQIVDSPDKGYARFECGGGATLSIACDHGESGGAAAYFECFDLDAVLDGLAARGIATNAAVDQIWLWRESWLTDPAGNRLCFYQAGINRRHPPWAVPRCMLPR
jgi:hydroxymethylpyrimidine/phosphomethylpyrimidine kinase